MKKIRPYIGKCIVLFIGILACWLLYDKLREYSLHEIIRSITQIRAGQLWAALFLVVLNYFILVGYDWLAVIAIGRRLPLSKVAFVSFTGCAVSYNIGAILGGTAVRYRLYSLWGFHPMDIVQLVFMLAVTFWIGAFGLAGAVLLFATVHIPPELNIDPAVVKPLGGCLFALTLAYLALCWYARGRAVRLFRREFALPTLRIALAQTAVACADLVVAAACMYVLLPTHSNVSFADFLPSYLLAQVAAVLSHVPGGVGVLEVVLMHIVHGVEPEKLIGAIVVFRCFYYLIPLVIAAVLLLWNELRVRVTRQHQE